MSTTSKSVVKAHRPNAFRTKFKTSQGDWHQIAYRIKLPGDSQSRLVELAVGNTARAAWAAAEEKVLADKLAGVLLR